MDSPIRPPHRGRVESIKLIMRTILSVALGLLLLLGISTTFHGLGADADVTVSMASLDSPESVTGDEEVGAHAASVTSSILSSDAVGAALCLLGVLCGLVIIAAARRVLRTRSVESVLRVRRHRVAIVDPPVQMLARCLSLTELNLSRT